MAAGGGGYAAELLQGLRHLAASERGHQAVHSEQGVVDALRSKPPLVTRRKCSHNV